MVKTKITLPSGDTFTADLPDNLKIGAHFTVKELANISAKDDVKFIINKDTLIFIDRIEEFRRWYNMPMTISSNYRTESYNEQVGGIKGSAHTKGLALDWTIQHSASQRNNVKARIFKQARQYGCGCHVIYYSWGYHIDFEGTKQILIDRR